MLKSSLVAICAAMYLTIYWGQIWTARADETTETDAGEKYFVYNLSLFDQNHEFAPIKFDEQLGGGFQISQCLRDLMECWTIMKAETICTYQNLGWITKWKNFTWWGSACDIMRDYCDNNLGDQYVPETRFWFRLNRKKLHNAAVQDCPWAAHWT